MLSYLHRHKKNFLIALCLCLVLFAGMGIGFLSNHVWSQNGRFRTFTNEIFENEVSESMLTLHYSLAHPEKKGISRPAPSLGTVSSNMDDTYQLYADYLEKLKAFSPDKLSRENQITLDMLLLYFHTQLSLKDHILLEEMLSPSLGIQAQLPVLLAEYTFYEDQDIADYLNLLISIGPYFQSILEFEEEKSQAGLFMSDTTLDRILDQCKAFIQDPDSNYMLEVFSRKIKEYGKFSKEEAKKLITRHENILKDRVIPAYQNLINGLERLRGTGKASCGLAHFEGGREYYEYLLKSSVGSYMPVARIEKRLLEQLSHDLKLMRQILMEQPSLAGRLQDGVSLLETDPDKILEMLKQCIQKDFPDPGSVSYEVCFVHPSMEKHLSPAFYLTPPLDTGTPNIIYINQADQRSGPELFSTLAHEGFPGHLYQTVYFGSTKPSDIRYLLSCGGYVEGWATYVESCISSYAGNFLKDTAPEDMASLFWLNRSINLCIYSLLDIGIHHQGWDQFRAGRFLKAFGIGDTSVIHSIYQYIVETPANYLKYYWGYLNFLDLREAQKNELGDEFDLKTFHQKILQTGPVPFPVLEKYIK